MIDISDSAFPFSRERRGILFLIIKSVCRENTSFKYARVRHMSTFRVDNI